MWMRRVQVDDEDNLGWEKQSTCRKWTKAEEDRDDDESGASKAKDKMKEKCKFGWMRSCEAATN